MGKIRSKQFNIGTSGVASGFQFHTGPGVVLGMAVDYSASADAGTVLTMYDGFDTSGVSLYTITGNTDIGTTVPVRLFQNGRLIAGTSTNNVRAGLPFFDGLFINIASDVAGPQSVRVWVKPLTRKTANITTTGSAGSASGGVTLFGGSGLFHAARVDFDPNAPSTTDITFYDGVSTSGRALTAVSNSAADWDTSALRAVVTTTVHDEAGNALTTAANAHENDGVLFYTGLHVALAQCDALTRAASVDALIEH